MKSRLAWLMTRAVEKADLSYLPPLAVIIPSKRTTNKSVDDLAREFHLRDYGRLWPNKAVWENTADGGLVLRTPLCNYKLSRIQVYG